jgi:uncharacterized membrane protein
MPFTTLDLIALAWFVAAWAGYAAQVEFLPKKKKSLNETMNQYRIVWMERMLNREARMVDMQVMATLVNGTAFSPRRRCSRSAARSPSCAAPPRPWCS